LGGILLFAGWGFSLKFKNQFCLKKNLTLTMGVFVGIYVVFLISSTALVIPDPDIRPFRHLAPVYFGFVFLVMVFLERVSDFWAKKYAKAWRVRFFLAIFIILWLGCQFYSVTCKLSDARNSGLNIKYHNFTSSKLRNMPMLNWLRSNPVKYHVFSNYPDIGYLYCGIQAQTALGLDDFFYFAANTTALKRARFILFFPPSGTINESPKDLISRYSSSLSLIMNAEIEATFKDGAVFFLRPKIDARPFAIANKLGVIHMKNNNLKKARFCFEISARLKPDNINTFYNLACVYARQKNIEKSLSWLKKAINLGFDNWEVLRNEPDLKNLHNTFFYMELVKRAD